jgi:hypothetical protein
MVENLPAAGTGRFSAAKERPEGSGASTENAKNRIDIF